MKLIIKYLLVLLQTKKKIRSQIHQNDIRKEFSACKSKGDVIDGMEERWIILGICALNLEDMSTQTSFKRDQSVYLKSLSCFLSLCLPFAPPLLLVSQIYVHPHTIQSFGS